MDPDPNNVGFFQWRDRIGVEENDKSLSFFNSTGATSYAHV
jgi:hypothetical protein